MKRLIASLAMILSLSAASAQADVIDFETPDINPTGPIRTAPIPAGYFGLNWTGMALYDVNALVNPAAGFISGTNGQQGAVTGYGTAFIQADSVNGVDFELVSAQLTSQFLNSFNIIVTGFNDGQQVAQGTYTLGATQTVVFSEFDNILVDSLRFTTNGAFGIFGEDPIFMVMDDLEIAPVPVPAAVWLLGSGLLGLLGLRRRG